jgi:hypothetical protein
MRLHYNTALVNLLTVLSVVLCKKRLTSFAKSVGFCLLVPFAHGEEFVNGAK